MRLVHTILTAISIGMIISSCAVNKKYQREELDLPTHFREEISVTADSIQLPWRRFVRDPKLVVLIDKALANNNDITIALKNLEQLDNSFKQAKLALLPTLDFSAGATRNYNSKTSLNGQMAQQFGGGNNYMEDFSSTLRLNWEVDIWGKAALQKEVARADYFAQQENLSALKTRIIVQVTQAYYNLVSLAEQRHIAARNVSLSDSTLQMMQLQYQVGQINSLALQQMEAQKKTAELLIPLVNQNIAVQENALSILCGSYPEAIAHNQALKNIVPEEVFATGIPAQMISRRPDVRAAEYSLMAIHAKMGLAKVDMYPTISLSPQLGTNSMLFKDWFNIPGSLTKTLAGNLAAPIFQKRALRTAYENAVIEQEKATVQFKQAVLVAVGEVSDALAKFNGATQRLVLVKEKAAALDNATRDALKLYQSGMATYLEVITAQNNRLQNDLDAVNIELEKLNASVDLYRALGGGVE